MVGVMDKRDEPTPPDADPKAIARAKEKADELRMHAELAAVYEGVRKFDAVVYPDLPADLAMTLQRTIGKLGKSRLSQTPILPPEFNDDAAALLKFHETHALSTNNYHLNRRPGQVVFARWLASDDVATFYQRFQAHFDAARDAAVDEQEQSAGWQQSPANAAYVKALKDLKMNLPDRYLRDLLAKNGLYALSTQSADEMNIQYLCEYLMDTPIPDIVGPAAAPPTDPSEQDLAWYFKLFALRGGPKTDERMCFFTFLQKTDTSEDW